MERLLLVLAIIFIAGRLLGEIAERLGQPAVIGEIIAGVIVGPALLDWVPSESEPVEILAELGAIFLLFMVGLEASLYELRKT
ncbi:MAG: cation:proton antiporter, partial [Actinomycetota bacterium]